MMVQLEEMSIDPSTYSKGVRVILGELKIPIFFQIHVWQ
jgi:hypothetical protein